MPLTDAFIRQAKPKDKADVAAAVEGIREERVARPQLNTARPRVDA